MIEQWRTRPVKKMVYSGEDSLKQAVTGGEPVLFQGLTKDWPAYQHWPQTGYLESVLQDRQLEVGLHEDTRFNIRERAHETMTFAEFRNGFLNDKPNREEKARMSLWLEPQAGTGELIDDVQVPALMPKSYRARLFLGRDFVTQNHYHAFTEALLCQVSGSKRAILFKPSDFKNLYPYRWNRNLYTSSRILFSFDNPGFDTDRFPEAEGLEVFDIHVQAGDALYIPVYYPHLIFSADANAAVTFFWGTSLLRRWTNPLVVRRKYLRQPDLD